MNSVSENGSDFIHGLGDAVRKNPVSAALIGMGVLWLFSGSKSGARAVEFVRSTAMDRIPNAAGDAVERARSALRPSTDAVGEQVASVTGATKESAADNLDGAARYGQGAGSEVLETVRSNLSEVFKTQPLALGAIGIAIGVGIAAALPATKLEADYLGEASDGAKAKASEYASEQAERASNVAGKVLEAVTAEAERQGLTMESGKAAASAISAKVGRVVDAAGKGISERPSRSTP
jgi:hypothetical protein